ncbi:MAG: leucine-rich repeat protein [Oscillospiraceae bacterium]|nr:leucine-rich repeat protein [Oscillospiraceae bacterium]
MKNLKNLTGIFGISAGLLLCPALSQIPVQAENSAGMLTYEISDDHVMITACDKKADSVEIPTELDNLPVTEIAESAFAKCTALQKIFIPESVTTIGQNAFSLGIAEIEVSGENPAFSSSDGVLFDKEQKILIEYPDCHPRTNYTVPDSVMEIAPCAFSDSRFLTVLVIPDSVELLGESACKSCSVLEQVILSNALTELGNQTFCFCRNLADIRIPDGMTKIGGSAFANCSKLSDLVIPESVMEIGRSAFEKCRSLKHLTILNPACEISDDAKTIPATTVLHGYLDSTAYFYGVNSNPFMSLGEHLEIRAVPGDLTGDEEISVADLIRLQKYLLGQENLQVQLWKNADLNRDRIVNIYDWNLLKKIILEK